MPEREHRPFFLITVDTEGDDLWSGRREIGTRNARFLPRFQALCERYTLRPSWLVSYEMAVSEEFAEFARDVIARGTGEIGMHLHAWNTPPLHSLSPDDHAAQPYLTDFPDGVMEGKIGFMTGLLEETFGVKMLSHRAGRWGFDGRYARMLAARGYLVDCSVTPHVSWRRYAGAPGGPGGPDFRGFPDRAYFLDPDDISREGDLPLLEVPVTILREGGLLRRAAAAAAGRSPLLTRVLDRVSRPVSWLRPDGGNGAGMIRILDAAIEDGRDFVELMLHSSELMPGGSPRFRSAEAIESLYRDLERLFDASSDRFRGGTLREYHAWYTTAR